MPLDKTIVKDVKSNISENICPVCPADTGYCKCGSCDECEYFATDEGFSKHLMNDHEPKVVLDNFGRDWVRKQTQYIHKNFNYAQDRYHFKKWESVMDEHL